MVERKAAGVLVDHHHWNRGHDTEASLRLPTNLQPDNRRLRTRVAGLGPSYRSSSGVSVEIERSRCAITPAVLDALLLASLPAPRAWAEIVSAGAPL